MRPKLRLVKKEEVSDSNFVVSHVKNRLLFWAFIIFVFFILSALINLVPGE